MGIRNSYEKGIFCWVDLATTDQDAAKQFYTQLFHWDFEDVPLEDGGTYSMACKDGRYVAALFSLSDGMREQNIPPHWQSYINVADLEAAVQSWQSNGGSILSTPCDVMESGRMAVVKDPTGATVSLWQAKNHIGAGVVNEVNTFCWTELQTRSSEIAAQFYQRVFDWEIEVDEKLPYYTNCKVKGYLNCGIFDMDQLNLPPEIPSQWAVYFHVENLDTSLALVKGLGGKALMEPVVIDIGRFSTIIDPQGATLIIAELKEFDD